MPLTYLTGTALYVYGVLWEVAKGGSDMLFFIDSRMSGSFQRPPTTPAAPDVYIYDSLIWSIDSLPLGQHTFLLQNGRLDGDISLILLDYVVYTT